ncbi:dihydroxyacetone kinase subunit DhaL [Aidingimonas halophila]|uniref:Dihydroxyacetone kinase DhaL subunit n=1 Tax=Aidingimonas halophila TaxID=574349 RepID=A0A1H3FUJ1_9GAMM|nr:dihydroxyacetone kinase subunit DhaL [Aidingimonas halophila]GHC39394.1 dihydroxyacetone kinase subunit L [Aidingimonas halophila]SDX94495.1 dihydroxyacetone kinase DhaL subunit [Aidingimonas halophila]
MQFLDTSYGSEILSELVEVILDNRDYLSEVDGSIGDGDHGINMAKGFRLFNESIQGQSLSLSKALTTLANTLMGSIGGSMGPLYGSLFLGMGNAAKDRDELDAGAFGDMLSAGLTSLQSISDANVGDKCLLDTLVPAVNDYRHAVDNGQGFASALQSLRDGAKRGCESTRELEAKIGRASRLGERSKGHLDAGAVSCQLLLVRLADSTERHLDKAAA